MRAALGLATLAVVGLTVPAYAGGDEDPKPGPSVISVDPRCDGTISVSVTSKREMTRLRVRAIVNRVVLPIAVDMDNDPHSFHTVFQYAPVQEENRVEIHAAVPPYQVVSAWVGWAEKSWSCKVEPTEPPVTEPPVTEPPVTEPPVTEPPVTEPPVTEDFVAEPPVTSTSCTATQCVKTDEKGEVVEVKTYAPDIREEGF